MTALTSELEGHSQRGARRALLWGSRALSYLVYVYLLAVEIILFLGFFLLLFGANPNAGFTEWVYRSLDRAMEPFRGIFTPIELGTTGGNDIPSVFETSILFAMIIYGIVAIVVHAGIMWLTGRLNRLEAEEANLRYWAAVEEQRVKAEQAAASNAGQGAQDPGSTGVVPPTTEPPPPS